jgi:hypothetical protein
MNLKTLMYLMNRSFRLMPMYLKYPLSLKNLCFRLYLQNHLSP